MDRYFHTQVLVLFLIIFNSFFSELDELLAYQRQTESRILQPQKDFAQFVEACFGPFSATLAQNGPYKELEKEAENLMAALHEKLDRRKRELMPGLSSSLRSKVKLTTIELKVKIPMMISNKYGHDHNKYVHI